MTWLEMSAEGSTSVLVIASTPEGDDRTFTHTHTHTQQAITKPPIPNLVENVDQIGVFPI